MATVKLHPKLRHFQRVRQLAPRACRECIHALRCLASSLGTCTRCGLTVAERDSVIEKLQRTSRWWDYTDAEIERDPKLRQARDEFHDIHGGP